MRTAAQAMWAEGVTAAEKLDERGTNPDPLRGSAIRARSSSPRPQDRSARVLGVGSFRWVDWNFRRRY